MARNHARWKLGAFSADPDLRARTPHAKLVYAFLVQDTYLNPAGVLISCEESWAEDLGLSDGQMQESLVELEGARFIVWDRRTHELLVRSYIRNDGVADQPNVLKQALAHARRIKSKDLRRVLAGELRRLPQAPEPKPMPNGRTMVYPDPHACADEIEASGNQPTPPSGNTTKNPSRNPSEKGVQAAFSEPQGEGEGEGEVVTSRSSSVGETAKTPRKRGSRLPEDWDVTRELVEWVRDRCPDIDARFHTEKFKNYWHAKTGANATKLDWDKTWKNWMLDEQQKAGPVRPGKHLRPVPAWQPTIPDVETAMEELRKRVAGPSARKVAEEAAHLIGDAFIPSPRPRDSQLSEIEWNRRLASQYVDDHADEIRTALERKAAG